MYPPENPIPEPINQYGAPTLLKRDPDDTGHADTWVCLTSPHSLDRDGVDGRDS